MYNSRENRAKRFFEKFKVLYGDKYDLSDVEYVDSHTHITIRCIEHDEVRRVTPGHLLSKRGYCTQCRLDSRKQP